jgi:hypothetical protein
MRERERERERDLPIRVQKMKQQTNMKEKKLLCLPQGVYQNTSQGQFETEFFHPYGMSCSRTSCLNY